MPARAPTKREREVFRLHAIYVGAKAGADKMGISIHTYNAHSRGLRESILSAKPMSPKKLVSQINKCDGVIHAHILATRKIALKTARQK